MTDSRRQSLPPKSILKQKLKEDENTTGTQSLTMSQIQFPTQGLSKDDILEGNNTTSKISTSFSKGNRRVSFAPDVTLHKFDFIPQLAANAREPRRKSALKQEIKAGDKDNVAKQPGDNSGETMEFTSPIESIFQNEKPQSSSKVDPYQPVFDKEVSMDITQLFAKHSAKPESPNKKVKDNSEQADGTSMEFTLPQKPKQKEEESMEMTDQIRVDDESVMEMTSLFSKHRDPLTKIEETMDFTSLKPLEIRSSQVVSSTQLKTPQNPSKRRKLSNGSYQSPVKVQVYGTPEQPEKENDDLSDMERLSPIPLLTDMVTNLTKETFPPDKNVDTKDSLLATQSQVDPIPLNAFLEATGVKFKLQHQLDTFRLVFPSTNFIDKIPVNLIYQALYCKIPILEIQSFTAKELNRRILQSQSLLKHLQDQIAVNSPPRLIKEYFEANEQTQEEINNKLGFATQISRLQSEKVWYEWRSQHLKGIKTVLEENFSILLDEHAQIMKYMNEINDVKIRVNEIKDLLSKELSILSNNGKEVSNNNENVSDMLKVGKLKEELRNNLLKVGDIDRLCTEKNNITSKIESTKSQISDINTQINNLQNDLNQSKICTTHDIDRLKLNFDYFQKISGIQLKMFTGSDLSVSLFKDKITVNIDLSNVKDGSCLSFSINDKKVKTFEKSFINSWVKLCKIHLDNGPKSITYLQKSILHLSIVISEFERLNLAFPTRIESSKDGFSTLVFENVDRTHHCKLSFSLPVDQFIQLICDDTKTTINAKIIYGENGAAKNIAANFIRMNDKTFQWLCNCSVAL